MKVDPEAARMVINIRYPVTYTAEELASLAQPGTESKPAEKA